MEDKLDYRQVGNRPDDVALSVYDNREPGDEYDIRGDIYVRPAGFNDAEVSKYRTLLLNPYL